MQRSTGVLLSAILVLLGCAATVLFAALMVIGFAVVPAGEASSTFIHYAILFTILVFVGLAGWGIATVFGLLGLRNWARISMLVFSGLMAVFCFFPMIVMPFVPIPQSDSTPRNFQLIFHAGSVIFYGFFVALGVFWVIYFNKRGVKAQFVPAVAVSSESAAAFRTAVPVDNAPVRLKRPILITVWSWFLIASALFAPLVLVLHTPLILFGRILVGRPFELWAVLLAAAGLAAGIGMLKLRWWGWAVALCLQLVTILNSAYTMAVPGAMARFLDAMQMQQSAMGLPSTAATLPPALLEVSSGFGALFAIAVFVMLLIYRQAFAEQSPAPPAAI
ncbi:MAG TPA: hypothetical protein VNU84_05600 [Candidatus Acidoferrum sp.]|jgi:hypothetical protein|nr:hypothetical protein [Candidatus Acidoferrum sp.]